MHDQEYNTVGKVVEATFRLQPDYIQTWTESSCWRGFYGGPIPLGSCLADPRGAPSSQSGDKFTLQDGLDWLVDVGAAPEIIAAVSEEIQLYDLETSVDAFLSLPISGNLLSEAKMDATLRQGYADSPWYPLQPHGSRPGGWPALWSWTDPPCIGEKWFQRQEPFKGVSSSSRTSFASSSGSGPVALVMVVPKGGEQKMSRMARSGLSLDVEWHAVGRSLPDALNSTDADLMFAVWAEDVPLAASLLSRHVRRFTVTPYGRIGLLRDVSKDAETVCLLQSRGLDGMDVFWKCIPSSLLRELGSSFSQTESFPGPVIDRILHEQGLHQNGTLPAVETLVAIRTRGVYLREEIQEGFELGPGSGNGNVRYVMPLLNGLLGNILFQVAASLSFAWDLDDENFQGSRWKVLLPSPRDPKQCGKTFLLSLLSHPSIHRRVLSEVDAQDWHYADEGSCFICHHPILGFGENIGGNSSILVRGWRQSHLYFSKHRRRILRAFSLPSHLEEVAQTKYRQLLSHALGAHQDYNEVETVSVHIRRGDLLLENGTLLTTEYYRKAIEMMGRDRLFLVFSDDIEWCKSSGLFDGIGMVAYVEIGIDFLELRLISMCDHHIIANSTFSFWAAYLHNPPSWRKRCRKKRKKTVVTCPAEWKRAGSKGEGQIYPEGWIRL